MFVYLHKDVHTCTLQLIYDNLSFSDICHNDPWCPMAYEVCFSSGNHSVYRIHKRSLKFPCLWRLQKAAAAFSRFLARRLVLPAIGPDSLLRAVHEKELTLCAQFFLL